MYKLVLAFGQFLIKLYNLQVMLLIIVLLSSVVSVKFHADKAGFTKIEPWLTS